MIRMIQITSAQHLSSYFSEDLKTGGYYTEGITAPALWGGQLAARLGLSGTVNAAAFQKLGANRHPETGRAITPRTNKKNRTVAYDINFHPPKSLSLMLELTEDSRLEKAFTEAVTETLARMEAEMQTRVRRGQSDGTRATDNWVYALFQHHCTRPVENIADPHCHCHAIVFNLTHDGKEDRIKAGHFQRIQRELPYYKACFQAALSRKVMDLGYAVTASQHGWEIAGVPQNLIRRFSRRTALINRIAQEKGLGAEAKNALGATLREAKPRGMTRTEYRIGWRKRISDAEYAALEALRNHPDALPPPPAARPEQEQVLQPDERLLYGAAVFARAVAHHFERETVVSEKRLWATALRFGLGLLQPEDLPSLAGSDLLRREHRGQVWCTTREAVRTEREILAWVRAGRGQASPIAPGFRPPEQLSPSQSLALQHLVSSTDQVLLLEGKAGTGKSTLLAALRQTLGEMPFHAIAPTAEAAEVLQKEGFASAQTLASFLLQTQKQKSLHGGLLIVDEAGLVGAQNLHALLRSAREEGYRVLLCGDSAQHKPVERSVLLDTIVRETGIVPATLYDIRRQSGAYREAVVELSRGNNRRGLDLLDRLGAVRQIADPAEREQAVVGSYLESLRQKASVLLICPTHAEGDRITQTLRQSLIREKRLTGKTRTVQRFISTAWTEAERQDGFQYQPGMVIELTQNAKGYRKGARYRVVEVSPQGQVYVQPKGREGGKSEVLDLSQAKHFKVCRVEELALQKGDVIRIGQNGKSLDGSRLLTGSLHTVTGFSRDGSVVRLENGAKVAADYGHWSYGYVSTSHASQGKTCDHVIICQSVNNGGYASADQFYVSVSRGRSKVRIFIDDRQILSERLAQKEQRLSATDLLRQTERRKERTAERQPGLSREQQLYENTARLA